VSNELKSFSLSVLCARYEGRPEAYEVPPFFLLVLFPLFFFPLAEKTVVLRTPVTIGEKRPSSFVLPFLARIVESAIFFFSFPSSADSHSFHGSREADRIPLPPSEDH